MLWLGVQKILFYEMSIANNHESPTNTVLCAAFCGAGKTYICNKTNIKSVEVEYWKYKERVLFIQKMSLEMNI